jgi:hypothetical protein
MANPVSVTLPDSRSASPARRLPRWADLSLLYAAVAVPVHTWAVLIFFHSLPSYLLRLSIYNILIIFAYVLVLALVESALVTAGIAILGLVLPAKIFDPYANGQGVGLTWLVFAWLLVTHIEINAPAQIGSRAFMVALAGPIWWVTLVGAILGLLAWIRRHPGLGAALTRTAERITLLAGLYFFLDIAGLAVVLIRLLF